MKNRYKKVIVVILIALTSSGADIENDQHNKNNVIKNGEARIWHDESKPSIHLEKVMTFGDKELQGEAVLSSARNFRNIATDEAQNVYLVDNGLNQIISFNREGKLRWKTGNKGRGPGDIEKVSGLSIYKNKILISNISGSRIDEFDLEGNYDRSYNLEAGGNTMLSLCGVTKNGEIILRSNLYKKIGVQIFVLDYENDLNLISDFTVIFDEDKDYLTGLGVETTVIGNEIVIMSGDEFSFSFYDTDGTKIKEVKRGLDTFLKPGNYKDGTKRAFVPLSDGKVPKVVNDSLLVNSISWPVNVTDPNEIAKEIAVERIFPDIKREHSLDFYHKNGRLLYSFRGEEVKESLLRPEHADGQGNFYVTTDEPYPQVQKYAVQVIK